MQSRVGFDDPCQLRRLFLGQVLRVLQQREPGPLQALRPHGLGPGGAPGCGSAARPGRLGAGKLAGLVPRLASHVVECLSGPLNNVERISNPNRVRACLSNDISDEVRPIRGDMCDQRAMISPRASKNCRNVALLRPGAAHTSFFVS